MCKAGSPFSRTTFASALPFFTFIFHGEGIPSWLTGPLNPIVTGGASAAPGKDKQIKREKTKIQKRIILILITVLFLILPLTTRTKT